MYEGDTYNEDKECYAALADEMNDEASPDWVEADWDEHYVAAGKRYAKAHDLPWPPRKGDFDG